MRERPTTLQDDSRPARKRSRTDSRGTASDGDPSEGEEDDEDWEEAILGAVGDMPQLKLGKIHAL